MTGRLLRWLIPRRFEATLKERGLKAALPLLALAIKTELADPTDDTAAYAAALRHLDSAIAQAQELLRCGSLPPPSSSSSR